MFRCNINFPYEFTVKEKGRIACNKTVLPFLKKENLVNSSCTLIY